jgi:hypothetical protein
MINSTINRIRRNHGLEHATIHILSEGHKRFSAQGNSDHRGFHLNIYGDVTEEEVAAAVAEAHRRLRAGERHLAVHPNCGTVLVTTALLATLAAQGVFTFEQWRAEKKPSPNPSHREGNRIRSSSQGEGGLVPSPSGGGLGRGSGSDILNLLNALPSATLAVVGALIVGRPLGITLQERYTVDGDIRDLAVASIRPVPLSPVTRLFQLLLTAGNRALPPHAYFVRTVGGEE